MKKIKIYRKILSLLLFVFSLLGCSPNSIVEYYDEGEGLTRDLIFELEKIQTREDLVKASSRLKKIFEELVNLIIGAGESQIQRPDLFMGDVPKKENKASDLLRRELNRIYRMDGGRELIEAAQANALHRLDTFETRSPS